MVVYRCQEAPISRLTREKDVFFLGANFDNEENGQDPQTRCFMDVQEIDYNFIIGRNSGYQVDRRRQGLSMSWYFAGENLQPCLLAHASATLCIIEIG